MKALPTALVLVALIAAATVLVITGHQEFVENVGVTLLCLAFVLFCGL